MLCTYQLSKRLILDRSSYSIKTLSQHFGIKLKRHHNALDDTKACAELFIRLCSDFELNDENSIYSKTDIRVGG
ncbi:exonuclease domain-containing protein [Natribacillus halophilus]|uniref:exonuclease domain-containing protein n=1 Tax=Natribacillus halophilus TaxID=549003 RepID=UPI00115FEF55